MRITYAFATVALAAMLGSGPASAQATQHARSPLSPSTAPCPVYSPTVGQHIDKAYQLLGDDLPGELVTSLFIIPRMAGLCAPERVPQYRMDNSLYGPARAFDQLSYVGNGFVGVWVLETSGGIILFDTMNSGDEARDVIEPRLRQLGLDPKNIRYIIITHGHGDHAGGAKYFQDHYGSVVLIGRADEALVRAPHAAGLSGYPPLVAPTKLQPIDDGMVLKLGDTAVALYVTPGHTPGSIAAVFPVTDKGRPHEVALFGGYGLPTHLDMKDGQPGLLAFEESVRRFRDVGEAAGVDSAISTHPLFEGTLGNINLISRSQPATSPWIMGRRNWVRYMDAMLEVAKTVETMEREHPVVWPKK
jgi:metallo-beta-lactamase class B